MDKKRKKREVKDKLIKAKVGGLGSHRMRFCLLLCFTVWLCFVWLLALLLDAC